MNITKALVSPDKKPFVDIVPLSELKEGEGFQFMEPNSKICDKEDLESTLTCYMSGIVCEHHLDRVDVILLDDCGKIFVSDREPSHKVIRAEVDIQVKIKTNY